jgi:hypothetical protein
MEGEKADYAMVAACDAAFGNLVTGHAYTVLGAVELTYNG